uniref:ICOS ligand isoform X5 n=1 Tax=Geotrypetes seraphini TaxID=260995 RepID=A0A6P8RC68_GEOSA|nr:ICOS ligand isoform X5 [Geotrypetes seraphini]
MDSARENRSRVLLLLLCSLKIGDEKEHPTVVGKAGKSAMLRCIMAQPLNFPLDHLRVYWQTLDNKVVHTFLCGDNASYRPSDPSDPEVNEVESGEEVTFTCSSSNGYPEPKVHWTDATHNGLPATSVTLHKNMGQYSVFSILKLNVTTDLNLSCSIENQLLQENITIRQFMVKVRNNGSLSIPDKQRHDLTQATISISCVVILVAFVGFAFWLYKRKPSSGFYNEGTLMRTSPPTPESTHTPPQRREKEKRKKKMKEKKGYYCLIAKIVIDVMSIQHEVLKFLIFL